MFKSNDCYVPNDVLRHWADTAGKQDRQTLPTWSLHSRGEGTIGCKIKQYSNTMENPDA